MEALGSEESEASQPFRPIVASRAFEEVVDQLTNAIHVGTYGVGARLPTIEELADAMHVSHSTVLEAVRLLERAGVVSVKRGARGGIVVLSSVIPTSVFKLSSNRLAHDISELHEAWKPIELELGRLAVERGAEQEIQEVRKMQETMENTVLSSDEWIFANFKFHYAIGKAAHSDVLVHFQTELTKELTMFMEEEVSSGDDQYPVRVHEEHRMILRGLETRDVQMVQAAIAEHLSHL